VKKTRKFRKVSYSCSHQRPFSWMEECLYMYGVRDSLLFSGVDAVHEEKKEGWILKDI